MANCTSETCTIAALRGQTLCFQHKCSTSFCSNKRQVANSLCSDCDTRQSLYQPCAVCGKSSLALSKSLYSDQIYCHDHVCQQTGCYEASLERYNLCKVHKCSYPNCPNNCDCSHTCRFICGGYCPNIRNCNALPIDNTELCKDHTCEKSDCNEIVTSCGSRLCEKHDYEKYGNDYY